MAAPHISCCTPPARCLSCWRAAEKHQNTQASSGDEDAVPGEGMLHAVFKAVVDAALECSGMPRRPVSPAQASKLAALSEEAQSLKDELEAVRRFVMMTMMMTMMMMMMMMMLMIL
jgi:hypothetical protein